MNSINTWPGWVCVREIGHGSFGTVYEIQREDHGKIYKAALKVITIPSSQSEIREAYGEGMSDQNVTEYFQEIVDSITEEFALMSEFKGQSNIVSYEDHRVIEHEDRIGWDIVIRMEMLTSLSEWSITHPLKEADVIAMGCDICRALELCWQKRIIHRDIKPDNIFVNEYGDYKLGDFGIARTVEKTRANLSQKGTYTYIAPEVFKGQEYGHTADIYSLGIVLYRYLNDSRMPFVPVEGTVRYNEREEALKKRLCGEQIPPPVKGSQRLKEVILKAVAYLPDERYQSAHEFGEALKGCVNEIGDESDRKGTVYLFPKNNTEKEDSQERETQVIRQMPQEALKPQEEPKPQNEKKKKTNFFTVGMACLILLAILIIMVLKEVGSETLSESPDSVNKSGKTDVKEEIVDQEDEATDAENMADDFGQDMQLYQLDEIGLSVSIPSEYDVVTRETKILPAWFIAQRMTLQQLLERNIYLLAQNVADASGVVITCLAGAELDINSLSIGELEEIASLNVKGSGGILIDFDVYEKNAKYMKIHYSREEGGRKAYYLSHSTIFSGREYMVTLFSAPDDVTSSERDALQAIVDSMMFTDTEGNANDGASEHDSASYYKNEEAKIAFPIPDGWSQESEETGLKLRPIGVKSSSIDYDYGSPWEKEQKSLSKYVDNSIFTKEEIAEMLEIPVDQVSEATHGGESYYSITLFGDESPLGMTSMIYLKIYNGYLHMFRFIGEKDSGYYEDFESFMETIEYLDIEDTE